LYSDNFSAIVTWYSLSLSISGALAASSDLTYNQRLFLFLKLVSQPADALNPVMPNLFANNLTFCCNISPYNI